MMNDEGITVGIEHINELYETGLKNIQKSHSDLLKTNKIILAMGDGRNGYPDLAPYNCIHVGAGMKV
jgi:protein-L-isoaspartate(D-aspartate) O-methyltransferase